MPAHIVALQSGAAGVVTADYDDVAPVPEPATFVPLGIGAVAAVVTRCGRKTTN